MSHTITTTIYSFIELSPKAQEKALDNLRDINVEDQDWDDFVISDFKDTMFEQGYDGIDVQYSGFASQGDGVSFSADVDLQKWLDQRPQLKEKYATIYAYADDININITKARGFMSQYSMNVDNEVDWSGIDEDGKGEEVAAQLQEVMDAILEGAQDSAHQLYKDLEAEYDYQTSDEQVKENIEVSEQEFTEDGQLA
jgi:hypothetical protein